MIPHGARFELFGKLLQAELGVQTTRRIHQGFGLMFGQFPARAKESRQLQEQSVDIHRLVTVLPTTSSVSSGATRQRRMRTGNDYDRGGMIEERIIA